MIIDKKQTTKHIPVGILGKSGTERRIEDERTKAKEKEKEIEDVIAEGIDVCEKCKTVRPDRCERCERCSCEVDIYPSGICASCDYYERDNDGNEEDE